MNRLLTAALLAASIVPPAAARAADAPPYARPAAEATIRGVIDGTQSKYGLSLHDEHGYVDAVATHQGTIINPEGLQLRQGMNVTIYGHVEGNVFAATRIDVTGNFVTEPYQYGRPWGLWYGRSFAPRFGW